MSVSGRAPSVLDSDLELLFAAQEIADIPGSRGLVVAEGKGLTDTLGAFLPSKRIALRDYKILKADIKEIIDSDVIGSFNEELSSETIARFRYARRYDGSTGFFPQYGPLWGAGLGLWFELLGEEKQVGVAEIVRDLGLDMASGKSALQRSLKLVTGYFKKHGDLASDLLEPGDWRVMINLELLGDYATTGDFDEVFREIHDWLGVEEEHVAAGPGFYDEEGWHPGGFTKRNFLAYFRVGIRFALGLESLGLGVPLVTEEYREWRSFVRSRSRVAATEYYTHEEYAARPGLYAGSGSSSVRAKTMYRDRRGRMRRVRKSKSDWVFNSTPASRLSALRTMRHDELRLRYKVIMKRERGKVRPVISSPNDDFLRQSYLAGFLERILRDSPLSTLFMSTSQSRALWAALALDSFTDRVSMPLDQSHFDHGPNWDMYQVIFDVIEEAITNMWSGRVYAGTDPQILAVRRDLLFTVAQLRLSLAQLGGVVDIEVGGRRGTVEVVSGMPSGWRMTALFDTLLNIGEAVAADLQCKFYTGRHLLIAFNAQGDDDMTQFLSYGDAIIYWWFYKHMNFEVNPMKFFLSTDRDEYLRLVIDKTGVRGYLARAVGALLTRNPISRDPPPGIERISEQLAQWNLVVTRGASSDIALHHMLEDMRGGSGLSEQQLYSVLFTPAALGGMGLEGTGLQAPSMATLSPGVVKYDWRPINRLVGLEAAIVDVSASVGIGVDVLQLSNNMASSLEAADAKREVVEAVYKPVDHSLVVAYTDAVARRGLVGRVGTGGHRFRMRSDIDPVVGSAMLRDVMREQRTCVLLDMVNFSFLDSELVPVSNLIYERGGARVWRAWVLDDLPARPPVIWGVGAGITSAIYSNLWSIYWARLLSSRKYSWRGVVGAVAVSEVETFNAIVELVARFGSLDF